MQYGIVIEQSDVERLHQLMSESYLHGREVTEAAARGEPVKNAETLSLRLKNEVENQAQIIASRAFEAGRNLVFMPSKINK